MIHFPSLPACLSLAILSLTCGAGSGWCAIQDIPPEPDRRSFNAGVPSFSAQQIPPEIESLFSSLGESIRGEDLRAVMLKFDFEKMLLAAVERNLFPKDAAIDRDRTRALRTEFRKRAGSLLSYLRWDEIRWLSFEMPDSEHANLNGRFIDRESDTCIPFRWWLVKRQGDWRAYDVELSDHGLRLSLALAMDSAAKFRLPWLDDLNNVGANYDPTDSYEGEFDSYDALDISDEMIAGPVPAEAHAFVHYCRIQLMSETGEDVESLLEELADFDSLEGDFPVRTRLRGWLLSLTDDYPGAIEAYEAWSSQMGYNAKTLEAIADCWWQLDNREKAVELALRGLADSELSEGCLATLAVALPPGRKSELDEHFEKHSFSADVLASTIDWCTANNDREAALHCYRLLRQHHPDSELQEHYRNALEIEDF